MGKFSLLNCHMQVGMNDSKTGLALAWMKRLPWLSCDGG